MPKPFPCQRADCPGTVTPPGPGDYGVLPWANAQCDTCGELPTEDEVAQFGRRYVETVPPVEYDD